MYFGLRITDDAIKSAMNGAPSLAAGLKTLNYLRPYNPGSGTIKRIKRTIGIRSYRNLTSGKRRTMDHWVFAKRG